METLFFEINGTTKGVITSRIIAIVGHLAIFVFVFLFQEKALIAMSVGPQSSIQCSAPLAQASFNQMSWNEIRRKHLSNPTDRGFVLGFLSVRLAALENDEEIDSTIDTTGISVNNTSGSIDKINDIGGSDSEFGTSFPTSFGPAGGAGQGINQDSEDLGGAAGAQGGAMAIAGAVLVAIGLALIILGIECLPCVIIGIILLGMGLLMLSQAAADSGGQSAADDVNGATRIKIPEFPEGSNPLENLDLNLQKQGGGIFATGSGGKTVDSILEEYRQKGYSYDANTKSLTTPDGVVKSGDFNSVEGLVAQGVTAEQAKKILGIGKAVYGKTLNGDYGPLVPGGKKKGEAAAKLLKRLSKGLKPIVASSASGGGGASEKYKRPTVNRLKLLPTRKGLRINVASAANGAKKRLYYGTPIGARIENIFDLITKKFKDKNSGNYFIQSEY